MTARLVQFFIGITFLFAGTALCVTAWQRFQLAGFGSGIAYGIPGIFLSIVGVLLLTAAIVPAPFWERFVSAPRTGDRGLSSNDRGSWDWVDLAAWWW